MSPCKPLPFCAALALTGYSPALDYQRPAIPVPQQFSFSQDNLINAADNYQNADWRTFFVDNQMKTLVNEALVNNRGLRVAALKVQETRAQCCLANTDRYPRLNGESSDSRSGDLKGGSATTRELSTGPSASFSLDFFGRLKNMSEVERQNYLTAEETQRTVYVLLASNVVQSYLGQQLAYAQLQTAEKTLCGYRRSYAFAERQLLTDDSNVLALEQACGVVGSTRSDITKRQGELTQANSALQLLLRSYDELP